MCILSKGRKYKILLKNDKEDVNNGQIFCIHGLEGSILLPDFTYRYNSILFKTPASCFVDITELILKFIWKDKRTRVNQPNTEGEQIWWTCTTLF